MNPKIVFFGTPEFAKIILEQLIEKGYKPALVVTAPDKPVGRKQILTPPQVKVAAEKYGIQVIQPATLTISNFKFLISKQFQNSNDKNLKIDLFIVAAYGKIIPKEILDIPRYGAINVHPSLLPKWRGPSPIQYAILNGEEKTGVTIMLLDEKMDHGPLLSQREFQISNFKFQKGLGKPTTPELSEKLVEIGGDLLMETIPEWISGKIKPQEQDHEKATYSKIIKKEDGRVDWSKSADELEGRVRAFTPWPGSFFVWHDKKIEIVEAEIIDSSEAGPGPTLQKLDQVQLLKTKKQGEVFKTENRNMAIQTAKGALELKIIKLEGKNEMNSKQFLNGYYSILGAVLD